MAGGDSGERFESSSLSQEKAPPLSQIATASTQISAAQAAVAPHIADAARATGADFDFLVRTAARESSFDPDAKAGTSSASGLFQFIDQTWLSVMHRHGADHGYGEYASAISQDENGRYRVSEDQRDAVLDLRFDPAAAALMAGELAAENAGAIEGRIGRKASSGELYAAHFLGASGAARLIETAEADPAARADQIFPAAARANRAIFFEGGRARSASEVLSVLTGEANARIAAPQARSAPQTPSVQAVATASSVTAARGAMGGMTPSLTGELSPEVVEILASLDAPESAGRRGKSRDA